MEKSNSFLKSVLPGSGSVYRKLTGRAATRSPDLEEIFSSIYQNNLWEETESVSGRGSILSRTQVVRRALPSILSRVGAKSILDAACGDFNWMQHVDLQDIQYTGGDVVPDLIARNQESYERKGVNFIVLDITSDKIPKADAILCRDCFIHLPFKLIHAAVANFKISGAKFLLATTHSNLDENTDTEAGGWRSINLQLPPFNFPHPEESIIEDSELGKCLGVWKLEEL